mmetsp:Transcript_12006/g.29114  ORF Transcript_12006/g.29114 Transcript_12006/m.29114 type:complete len:252 (+) Transcript_12006:3779-4534(+)
MTFSRMSVTVQERRAGQTAAVRSFLQVWRPSCQELSANQLALQLPPTSGLPSLPSPLRLPLARRLAELPFLANQLPRALPLNQALLTARPASLTANCLTRTSITATCTRYAPCRKISTCRWSKYASRRIQKLGSPSCPGRALEVLWGWLREVHLEIFSLQVRWQAPRHPLPPRELPRVRREFREGSEDSGWEAAAEAGQAPPVPQAETHFPADLTLGSRARPGLLPGRPAHRVATLLAVLEEHSAAALPAR